MDEILVTRDNIHLGRIQSSAGSRFGQTPAISDKNGYKKTGWFPKAPAGCVTQFAVSQSS
jgi:hypothetical protein